MAGDLLSNQPPNWEQVTLELQCPRCGYNLRMLTGCRCPECGLELEWERIIASAERQVNNPLFEYQWRRRPVRSYLLTMSRCLTPRRLWNELSIMDEPQVRPLAMFACVTVLVFVGVLLGMSVLAYYLYAPPNLWQAFINPIQNKTIYELRRYGAAASLHMVMGMTLWLFLQVFRQTISRYRIRQRQLLRVLCYTLVPLFLLKFTESLWWITWWRTFRRQSLEPFEIPIAIVFDFATIILVTRSLCYAMSSYLLVRRGVLVGLAGIGVSMLFWIVANISWFVIMDRYKIYGLYSFEENWMGIDAIMLWLLSR